MMRTTTQSKVFVKTTEQERQHTRAMTRVYRKTQAVYRSSLITLLTAAEAWHYSNGTAGKAFAVGAAFAAGVTASQSWQSLKTRHAYTATFGALRNKYTHSERVNALVGVYRDMQTSYRAWSATVATTAAAIQLESKNGDWMYAVAVTGVAVAVLKTVDYGEARGKFKETFGKIARR